MGTVNLRVATAAVVVMVCACGGDPTAVEIAVDLTAGQAWTARGAAVDAGAICDSGSRQVVEYRDPETDEPLPLHEVVARIEASESGRQAAPLAFVVEMTCADGSGTITILENGRDEVWRVLTGTGAYRDAAGGGSFTVEDSPVGDASDVAPSRLHMTGGISR